jgi:hypothetical protein
MNTKTLFMVLDPDGSIIRVITDETEFDAVRFEHFAVALCREMPRDFSYEDIARLASKRKPEIIPQYKLIRL